MGKLAGKTALVTGSTRGIGRIVAERLAGEGANLVVTGRGAEGVARAVEELSATGRRVIGLTADLARSEEAHRLAAETIAAVEKLDILVNNAGMSIRESFWDVSDERWDEQVTINFRSPFILAQHAARHMRDNAICGRIVNTSTVGAHHNHRDAAVYDSAKAAVEAMTRNMAWELGPDGITVNCVAPGPIGDRPGAAESRSLWDGIQPYVPVGRIGSASDVAEAVLFFCLPEASFVTGQTLLVDGGYGAALPESYF
jgi:NAD(P)-dependent dehydrogenase (short-subunit alcohol dehydrogenase family)